MKNVETAISRGGLLTLGSTNSFLFTACLTIRGIEYIVESDQGYKHLLETLEAECSGQSKCEADQNYPYSISLASESVSKVDSVINISHIKISLLKNEEKPIFLLTCIQVLQRQRRKKPTVTTICLKGDNIILVLEALPLFFKELGVCMYCKESGTAIASDNVIVCGIPGNHPCEILVERA